MVSMVAASVKPNPQRSLVRARFSYVLWAVLLCVMLAHLLVLQWAAGAAPLALQAMPEPIFARVLLPQTPPEPKALPSTNRPAPRAKPAPTAPPTSTPAAAATPTPEPTEEATAQPTDEPTLATSAQAPAEPAAAPSAEVAGAPQPAPQKAEQAPPVDPWPPSTRLTYTLIGNFRGDIFGNAKMQWQRQDDRYQVQMDIRLAVFFQLKLTSQGQITGAGLVPSRYEEVGPGRRSLVSIEAQQVRLSDGQMLPAPEGVQDTASQFLELAHRFATGRDPLKVGSEVALWLARPNGVELLTYDIVAEETLATAKLGPLQTFRLKPRPLANQRGNIVVELWFAPSLQYLPVRVLVTQGDGIFVDLLVETIEQASAAAP